MNISSLLSSESRPMLPLYIVHKIPLIDFIRDAKALRTCFMSLDWAGSRNLYNFAFRNVLVHSSVCYSRCPLQEDTPTTKPTCGPPVRSRLTYIAGAPQRTSLASLSAACHATRDVGAARHPTTRRATFTAKGGDQRTCIHSSRFHESSVMRTISSALAATKWLSSSTRHRWLVQWGARAEPLRSLLSQRRSSSTSSCCRISRSHTLSASLKRWGAVPTMAKEPH